MFCPFCGNENRGGKKFCRQCGKQMPVRRARAMEAGVDARNPDSRSPISDPRFAVGNRENYSPARSEYSAYGQAPAPDDPTGQLLQDTDKFEARGAESARAPLPPARAPFAQGNGSERPSNGSAPFLQPHAMDAMEMPGIPKIFLSETPMPFQEHWDEERLDDTPQSIPIEPPPGANSGELTSTDELEVLDKTIEPPSLHNAGADASAERPAESFLQGDASGISGGDAAKASRPFGFLSLYGSGEGASLERGFRVERLILAIAALFAIAGLSIIIWFLVFRSS